MNGWDRKFIFRFLLASVILFFSNVSSRLSLAYATLPQPVQLSAHALEERERASLRYHLKNLYNEVDLLIRNRGVDQADLKRQERDLEELKVYQRIPLDRDLAGLKNQLSESARRFRLDLTNFRILKIRYDSKPLPRQVLTHQEAFRISPDQLVETLEFSVTVKGSSNSDPLTENSIPSFIQNWTQSWISEQMRFTELLNGNSSIKKLAANAGWAIEAKAFRFRPIRYPTLIPPSPRGYLPDWAKKNPGEFSKQEPYLWSLITETEKRIPQTPPLYQVRAKFLLNDARLSFYLSKTALRH